MSNLQNTEILENLYDEIYDELSEKYPDYSDETLDKMATSLAQGKFEELPEPGDYDDKRTNKKINSRRITKEEKTKRRTSCTNV